MMTAAFVAGVVRTVKTGRTERDVKRPMPHHPTAPLHLGRQLGQPLNLGAFDIFQGPAAADPPMTT